MISGRFLPVTEQEAEAIYQRGEKATVAALLALVAEIALLKAQIAELNRKGYSPSTPSGMRPVYAKPSSKGRKKRPGRKRGHPGSHRRRPERVERVKEHTLSQCPHCHGSLSELPHPRTRYTEEIVPVPVEVTEHRIHRYWCKQCKRIVEPNIPDALPRSTIGLRSLILSCWQHYGLGIPIEKILQMLNQAFQFTLTKGGLIQAWERLALLLRPVYDYIGKEARGSAVLHADETGWRVNGKTNWLWCFTNKRVVYFVIDRSRGSPVVKRVLGKIFGGVLISDFFRAYNSLKALAKQRCTAHLFRELVKVDSSNRGEQWRAFRKRLCRLLRDAIRLHKDVKELKGPVYKRRKERLHKRLECIYVTSYQDSDCKRLAKRLRRHRDEIFTFLDHPEVSADNNHAERQLRPAVTSRKNSYGNRSQRGALAQAVHMSIFRTIYLREKDPVDTLVNLVQHILTSGEMPAAWDNCTSLS